MLDVIAKDRCGPSVPSFDYECFTAKAVQPREHLAIHQLEAEIEEVRKQFEVQPVQLSATSGRIRSPEAQLGTTSSQRPAP